jgi:hypothetical protein
MRKLSKITVINAGLLSLMVASTSIHAGILIQGVESQGSHLQGSHEQDIRPQGTSYQGEQRQVENGSFDFGVMKLTKVHLKDGDASKGREE